MGRRFLFDVFNYRNAVFTVFYGSQARCWWKNVGDKNIGDKNIDDKNLVDIDFGEIPLGIRIFIMSNEI